MARRFSGMAGNAGINRYYAGALLLMALGVTLLSADVVKGSAHAGIYLFIPYISGGGIYLFLGGLCLMGAFILLFLGFVSGDRYEWMETGKDEIETPENEKALTGEKPGIRREMGGVVLIGPFPIIFSSDRRSIFYAVALSVIAVVVMLVVLILLFGLIKLNA